MVEEEQGRCGGGGGAGGAGGGYLGASAAGGLEVGSQLVNDEQYLDLAHGTLAQLSLEALQLHHSFVGQCAGHAAGAAAVATGGPHESGGDQRRSGQGRPEAAGGQQRQQQQQHPEEGADKEQEQQQALLVEWYGLACDVASHAMRWTTGQELGEGLAGLMELRLPLLRDTGARQPSDMLLPARDWRGGRLCGCSSCAARQTCVVAATIMHMHALRLPMHPPWGLWRVPLGACSRVCAQYAESASFQLALMSYLKGLYQHMSLPHR